MNKTIDIERIKKQIRKAVTNWRDYIVVGIMGVMLLFILSIVLWQVEFSNKNITSILSPISLDKSEYRAGDVVVGNLIGETTTTLDLTVSRMIVCDSAVIALKPVSLRSVPHVYNGTGVNITTLDASSTLAESDIPTATNCVIEFTSTYCDSFLGVEQCNSRNKYYTSHFDIIK